MDPIYCCVLGICCPPASAEQEKAVTKHVVRLLELPDEIANGMARALITMEPKHAIAVMKTFAPVKA